MSYHSGGSRISRRGGGRGPRSGGMDSRGTYVSKNLYVEAKESWPIGGRAPGTPPLDPPMYHLSIFNYKWQLLTITNNQIAIT